jgi:hypothetical protein
MAHKNLSKISLAGFRRFLKRSPRARYRARSASRCPLARYTGLEVSTTSIAMDKGPAWAQEFVMAFDNDLRDTISGEAALEILMKSAYRCVR